MGLKLLKRNFIKLNKIEDKELYSLKETSEILGISVDKLEEKYFFDRRRKPKKHHSLGVIANLRRREEDLGFRFGAIKRQKISGKWFISKETLDTLLKCEVIGNVELKIHGRLCKITFRITDSWLEFFGRLNNEPQLIEGKILEVDNSNIKIPDRDNLYKRREAHERIKAQEKAIRETFEDYNFYVYKNNLYCFDASDIHTPEEQRLLIKEHYFKQEKKFKRLQKEIQLFEKLESSDLPQSREPIPEDVRFFVWRRDGGKCAKCGSKENLEFDHIIPISKGGSSTERNIQLLCEKCNREKSNKI